ncbi:MAG: hypothetical protein DCC71_07810 [Proteobacteria bacterium]|nr:MAG: hypothetical protein DCC71_07810 [Pseudomonadota bacterium]
MGEGVNYRKTAAWIRNTAQQRCLVPAVGLMCELYGEGEDLESMWSEPLGGAVPDLAGYTNFCDWYDSLTAPDLPDYTTK